MTLDSLNDFLRIRDSFNARGYDSDNIYRKGGKIRRTGDKLKISDSKGRIINLQKESDRLYKIHDVEKQRVIDFIKNVSNYIEIPYRNDLWNWDHMVLFEMEKGDFSKSRLNNSTFVALMDQNPFSLAMTSRSNIEYTLAPHL